MQLCLLRNPQPTSESICIVLKRLLGLTKSRFFFLVGCATNSLVFHEIVYGCICCSRINNIRTIHIIKPT